MSKPTDTPRDWVDYVPDFDVPNAYTLDGINYRATITHDHMSIMDEQGEGVWCGQLQWVTRWDDDRPENFNGGAEIIHRDGRDRLWWQPPGDCLRDTTIRSAVRESILTILHEGYWIVTVERVETCDHGHRHAADVASLGGINSTHDVMDIAEIVAELTDEVAPRDDESGVAA